MTKLLKTPLHFRYYNLEPLRLAGKFTHLPSKEDSNDENFEILWYDDQIAQVHWFQL